MVYNGLNKLVTATVDGTTTNYSYRPAGLRHNKVNGPNTTIHLWSGQNIVAELSGTGAVKGRYFRGIGLIAQQIDSNTQYYLFNAHGDIVQRTSANGTLLKSYDYDAFGVEKLEEPLDQNPFRYCGEYFDKETQTIYLRARSYNSRTGRFTSQDPARDGLNWYTYCGGNPLMFVDPSGCIIELDSKMSEEARFNIEQYLQMLTEDKLIFNLDKVAIREINPIKKKFSGTELLRELIQNEDRTVTIMGWDYVPGEEGPGTVSTANPLDYNFSDATNGVGTDAVIGLYWDVIGKVPTESSSSASGYEMIDMPSHIELGHELIHAKHIIDGNLKMSNTGQAYRMFYTHLNENGIRLSEPINPEEYLTIFNTLSVSENMLRKEQGLPLRALYGTILLNPYK